MSFHNLEPNIGVGNPKTHKKYKQVISGRRFPWYYKGIAKELLGKGRQGVVTESAENQKKKIRRVFLFPPKIRAVHVVNN